MAGNFWSEKEIKVLQRLYPSADWLELHAALPSRTLAAIHWMARAQNVKRLKNGKTFWTNPEKSTLKQLWPNAPWGALCKALPRHSRGAIARMAPTLGVRRDTARKSPYPIIRELREIRRQREIRQDVLADQIGTSPIQIAKWERGEHVPRLRALFDWAQALDCKIALTSGE